MDNVLTPPDVEQVLRDYLLTVLEPRDYDIPVGTIDPKDARSFVTLYRTGGSEGTLVSDRAQITFNCYAPTEYQAFKLGALVFGAVKALDSEQVDGIQFYENSQVGSLVNFANPRHPDLFRYQFSRAFHVRMQPA